MYYILQPLIQTLLLMAFQIDEETPKLIIGKFKVSAIKNSLRYDWLLSRKGGAERNKTTFFKLVHKSKAIAKQ